ncbi:S-DNA-T family DNA segregation ATPase FtsK/SpoIIIE [Mycolicibacterium sp. BK634]|uniref:type VII secretion protein EccCb n=1 Tax=Mycolicibacterium sp. BK634 TaxID=2587099 RepID=UPI00160B61DB|nr:type VII secretion protein EccCb [Mycolicibacterium sp. BK634]MBB3750005.1 S-DNA-T family DNA segregation ATPase FtsK/SpoIIIE [Mycolicibacterium sp. BK634]
MNRPVRLAPQFPTDDVVVNALPSRPSTGGISRFVPVLGVGAMVGVGAVMWASGMVSRGPTALMLPAMMLVSAVGMAMHLGARRAGGNVDHQRTRYLDGLGSLSEQLCDTARRQRASLLWAHPAPASLWTLIGGPRMWERRGADSDFCHVRVGLGRLGLARRIVVPAVGPVDDLDPVTSDALRRFVQCHSTVDDAPVAVALRGVGMLAVEGDQERARSLVRAMVCQFAALHGPDVVAISAKVGDGCRQHWDWLKWLPHNVSPHRGKAVVVIADGTDARHLARPGLTVIVIGAGTDEALRLHVDGDRLSVRSGDHFEQFATADGVTMTQAQMCARRLATYRRGGSVPDDLQRWRAALELDSSAPLRVPLGTASDGDLVELDIKEAAAGGYGPHGLCIGATGSGKSELLRTVVAGMIARHSSDDLNLVLIDFKGGATFLGLDGLPHVAAVITNLAEEAHLVARAKEALGGEIHRRQALFRRAGNAINLGSYQRQRGADPTLPVLPTLFIVVDEFAELLAHQPDFAELFTMIGRVGRSLGVHLLLASQRLDEGRLRGLESHLSYRICLKTSTAAESRAVLGVPDAADLPSTPGAALFRTGDGRLIRFQAAYLGARMQPVATAPSNPPVRLFTSMPTPEPLAGGGRGPTVFTQIVEQARGQGNPAHQVWVPPLTRSPHLSELDTAGAELTAAIALVDLPFEQRRAPMVVELGGAGGNVAIVGAPRSGKSTAVRTLITALASRHAARRVQFYCLDFGGGTLDALRPVPHVGSVASRLDRELVRRIVSHVAAILSTRESRSEADEYGDVFLVVDGWSTVREEFPDLETTITGFAARGLSFGVHVIMTAGRWADVRPGLKDQLGTRIELRLGDPVDSDIDRKQAAVVPIDSPGRGITRDGHHFLIATPEGVEVARSDAWRAPPVRLLPGHVELAAVVDQALDDPQRMVLGLGEDRLEPVGVDFTRQQHLLILGDGECGKTATLRALCGEIGRGATTRPAWLFVVDYRRGLIGIAESPHVFGYAFSAPSLTARLSALVSLLQGRLPGQDTPIGQLKARSWWTGPDVFVVVDDYDVVSATTPDALTSLLPLLPHAADIGLHLIVARRCAGSARALFDPVLAQLRDSGCAGLLMSGSPEEGVLIGHHRAAAQPPGRGLLVTRGAAQLVQIGWCAM